MGASHVAVGQGGHHVGHEGRGHGGHEGQHHGGHVGRHHVGHDQHRLYGSRLYQLGIFSYLNFPAYFIQNISSKAFSI